MRGNIVYRFATPSDHDYVLEFRREHFYKEEPLTISSEPREPDAHTVESDMSHLAHEPGTCIIAICDDEIVGAYLAGPKGRNEENHLLEEASRIPGTKWAKSLQFFAFLEREANVYEKYQVDKAMQGHGICVHKKFRGKGIGIKLYQILMERSRELGYPLFTVDCMSVYSARLCERLGMDCVNLCSFADYREPGSDNQVFFPPAENKIVKSFAIRL